MSFPVETAQSIVRCKNLRMTISPAFSVDATVFSGNIVQIIKENADVAFHSCLIHVFVFFYFPLQRASSQGLLAANRRSGAWLSGIGQLCANVKQYNENAYRFPYPFPRSSCA
ncbi:hypothetical protein Hsero_0049 [Herbaspirillum seropedicae SmR1]|uniref:Uncharacterized protein n=1 Tax=Herbaspirillum seropedicae (strain SmR1) TaxID=757424 RepID=D8ITT8_HERSS|nr:hypothetical protein Hsero_0049 [Herbaspirillum seropedicae SmR1]